MTRKSILAILAVISLVFMLVMPPSSSTAAMPAAADPNRTLRGVADMKIAVTWEQGFG